MSWGTMGTWLIFIEQLQSFLEEKKVMESFIFVDLFHISLQKTGLVHLVRYDGADFMFRRLIVTVIWFNLGSGS